jgi:type I restriction enzyme M protein
MSDKHILEKTLWQTANKLRNNIDAAEYKHVVLGLIFLNYNSDTFDDLFKKLKAESATNGSDPEDKDEYTAERVFYVPPQARWEWLQSRAKLPTIGKDIDGALDAIEKDNPSLKGVLPKNYARPVLDKQRLGELIDLLGSITLSENGRGKGKDVLGFVLNTSSDSLRMQKARREDSSNLSLISCKNPNFNSNRHVQKRSLKFNISIFSKNVV